MVALVVQLLTSYPNCLVPQTHRKCLLMGPQTFTREWYGPGYSSAKLVDGFYFLFFYWVELHDPVGCIILTILV